jgi:hypothetical protein
VTTSRGQQIDKTFIYRMLNNRVCIGEAVHKGTSYPGEHAAIVDREAWDNVHVILMESPRKRAARTRADTPALLGGLLYCPDGAAFSSTHMSDRCRRGTIKGKKPGWKELGFGGYCS